MSKKPTHIAYHVRDYEKQGEKHAKWTAIGVAWLHQDGKGFDVTFDCVPLNGRVSLRLNEPKPAGSAEPDEIPF